MNGSRSLVLFVGLLFGCVAWRVPAAQAVVAGTGQVTVTVNLLSSSLNVSATFVNATYGLGVNLGTVGTVSATSVALSNVNITTGASFVVPFANASNGFHAVGNIACPSGGCLAPGSGPYAFVGFLDNVNVSLLPADRVYTFDGSATCTGSTTLTCTGPFVLNAFDVDAVAAGASVAIQRTITYGDPLLNLTRQFTARVVLAGVDVAGDVVIAAVSRFRGTIPARYATSTGAFRALYFDVASDADFTSGRVCVEIDANQDGLIDGTNIPATRAAILHLVGSNFATVPLVFQGTFVCADGLLSLSPFVLVVDTQLPPTTTTTSTTTIQTTTIPTTTVSTTTVPTTTIPTTTISTTTIPTTTVPTTTISTTTIPTTTIATTTVPTTTVPTTTTSTITSPTTTVSSTSTSSTTSTTVRPACVTARDCLGEVQARPLCDETINPKLQSLITKKTNVALGKLGKAATATSAGKVARFVKQARAALTAIQKKADKFVTRKSGPISSGCRDSIRSALAPVLGALDANRP